MIGRGDRRRRRLLLVAGCAALVPALAACGIQASSITSLGPAPAADQQSAPAGTSISVGPNQYLLFFYLNDRLTPVYRPTETSLTEAMVLDELLRGPTAQEKAAGFSSALPIKLIATPNAEQERYAFAVSSPLGSRGRTEFICTLQYYDGTDSIGVELEGEPSTMIWTGCADTTSQYVPMQASPAAGAATPGQ